MPKFLEARSTTYCNVLKESWIIARAQLASTSVSSMLCSYRSKRLTQPALKIASAHKRYMQKVEPVSKMNKGVTTYLIYVNST